MMNDRRIEMFKKRLFVVTLLLSVVSLLMASCATPTPEIIEREVEKVVTQIVKETVKETVIVEGTPQVVEKEVTKVIEVEKEVTRVVEVEAPKGGEITIIRSGNEPKLLDAQVDPFDSAATFSEWVGGTLVAADPDGNFAPYLAESWETSEDSMQWTFKLRQDVTFHDGTPFNAEAVKYNFDRILNPDTQSGQSLTMIGPVVKTEVVDEFTFRLTHEKPFAPFLDSISEGFIPMWSPTACEQYGYDEFQQHLIGAGPFMLSEWKPAEKYVLVKNPDYNWAPDFYNHQGPAYLDKVTFRWVSEDSTIVAIWKAREADVFMGFPPANLPEVRQDPSMVTIETTFTGSPRLYIFNVDQFPTDDINVRKAAQFAINSQEIVDLVYRGGAIPVEHIMYPASRCYWQDGEKIYPYDPEQGKAILEEAGWVDTDGDGIREKDGQPLELLILNVFTEDLGTVVQSQLNAIGFDASIDFVLGPIQLERAQTGDWNTIYLHMGYADPGVLDMLWNSKNLRPGGWSWSRFKDARLDEVLDASAVEVNPDKRCELLVEAQQIIQDNALALPLAGVLTVVAHRDYVRGFKFGPRPNVDVWLYDTYVAE
jgi:peptide/nickel transport system substrate-binding protein